MKVKALASIDVSLDQLSDLLLISKQWANVLTKKEGLPRKSRGLYGLKASVQWYVRYLTREAENAKRGGETQSEEDLKKTKLQNQLLEIEVAKRSGQVITVGDAS